MLILTRKPGENVHIGDNIVVSVLGIKGTHVKLGITAPPEMQVQREEISTKTEEPGQKPSEHDDLT